MFFKKRYDKKNLEFFIVTTNENSFKYLTITNTLNQAFEFIEKILRFENENHYKSWLTFRKLEDTQDNWEEYFTYSIPDEEKLKYEVSLIKYSKQDLAAILRMFCGCVPLDCSFNIEAEYSYFEHKLQTMNIEMVPENQEEIMSK